LKGLPDGYTVEQQRLSMTLQNAVAAPSGRISSKNGPGDFGSLSTQTPRWQNVVLQENRIGWACRAGGASWLEFFARSPDKRADAAPTWLILLRRLIF
jgi:hypothetical protein